VFLVIRANSLPRYDDIQVALISVDRSHSHASVGIDAGQHERIGSVLRKQLIQQRSEERAVALFDDLRILRKRCQFRDDLGSSRAFDGNANMLAPHFFERVREIRLELLPYPNNRAPCCSESVDERPDCINQLRAIGVLPGIEKVD